MSVIRIGNKNIRIRFDQQDVNTIKDKTPVDTGRLRDGWELNDDEIINEVEYAGYVEYGTIHMPGAFMVERSIPEIQERLAERIANDLNQPGLITLPDIVIKVG